MQKTHWKIGKKTFKQTLHFQPNRLASCEPSYQHHYPLWKQLNICSHIIFYLSGSSAHLPIFHQLKNPILFQSLVKIKQSTCKRLLIHNELATIRCCNHFIFKSQIWSFLGISDIFHKYIPGRRVLSWQCYSEIRPVSCTVMPKSSFLLWPDESDTFCPKRSTLSYIRIKFEIPSTFFFCQDAVGKMLVFAHR